MAKSVFHDLTFEALYCGKNSEHAEIELTDNTFYGPMWWEQDQESTGFDATVLAHNMTRARPGRVSEANSRVFDPLPSCLRQVMAASHEPPPINVNDPRFMRFAARAHAEMEAQVAKQMAEFLQQGDPGESNTADAPAGSP